MNAPAIPTLLHEFLGAVDALDTDRFLALFAPNGVVQDWGHPHVGPEAIRAWSNQEFLGVQVTLAISRVVDIGGRITVKAEVGGNGFKGPSTFALVTDGEQIRELLISA